MFEKLLLRAGRRFGLRLFRRGGVFAEDAFDGFLAEVLFHELAEFRVFERAVSHVFISRKHLWPKIGFHAVHFALNILME